MKIYILVLLASLIFKSEKIFASSDKNFNIAASNLYATFCQGNLNKFHSDVKKITEDNPDYLIGQLMYSLTQEGQRNTFSSAQKITDNIEIATHADRILTSNILLMSRDHNFSKIKKLLEFNSNNKIIESYKLFQIGVLKINMGLNEEGFNYVYQAIVHLPFVDPFMLLTLFSSNPKTEKSNEIVKKYFYLIEKIPNTDASKFMLQIYQESTISGWEKNALKITSYINKAYELCPNDTSIALTYSAILETNFKTELAKQILQNITKNNYYYYPAIDVYLTRLYYNDHNFERALIHLNKSKNSIAYLSVDEKAIINQIDVELNSTSTNKLYAFMDFFIRHGLIFFLVTSLILILIIRRKSLKK